MGEITVQQLFNRLDKRRLEDEEKRMTAEQAARVVAAAAEEAAGSDLITKTLEQGGEGAGKGGREPGMAVGCAGKAQAQPCGKKAAVPVEKRARVKGEGEEGRGGEGSGSKRARASSEQPQA